MAFDISKFAQQLGTVSESDTGLREIPLDQIFANNKNFYPRVEDFDALRESIQANGLLEPLTVVPNTSECGGTYRIISGHNRWSCLQDLHIIEPDNPKWTSAVCLVLPPMTEAQELCAIIEANRQRKKTPAILQQEAERLTKAYVARKEAGEDLPGRIRDRVAEDMQLSKTKLANLSAIKNGIQVPGLVRAWEENRIPEAAALEIARMGKDEQYQFFDWIVDHGGVYTIFAVRQFRTIWICCKHQCPEDGGLCPNAAAMYRTHYHDGNWNCSGCCKSCLKAGTCPVSCQFVAKAEISVDQETQPTEKKDPRTSYEYIVPTFCGRLAALREKTGLSRKEFAEKLGEYPGTYSAWENHSIPGATRIPELAVSLGVSTDYLFGLTDEPNGFQKTAESTNETQANPSLNLAVWYPASFLPEEGAEIIIVDQAGIADDVMYHESGRIGYGLTWDDVVLWTHAPSGPTENSEPEPEGQLVFACYMPGGTNPAEPCLCACKIRLDSKLLDRLLWWDGEKWLFKRHGEAVQIEPVAWLRLPEYERGL